MPLTAQAILHARARKTTAHVGPRATNAATVDLGAVRDEDAAWRAAVASWPADERERWEERAAIMEFDGGLPRDQAERAAYDDTLETMK
jgi:hypothetical protein